MNIARVEFHMLTTGQHKEYALVVDDKHITNFVVDTEAGVAAFLKTAHNAAKLRERKIRGERLKAWRKKNRVTLRQMSARTGISFSHICALESGKKSWSAAAEKMEMETVGVWNG